MLEKIVLSEYDLEKRAGTEQLNQEKQLVSSWESLPTVLEPLSNLIVVLNRHRQVVYANRELVGLLGQISFDDIVGDRLGELFNCERASQGTAGCGTSEACRSCGFLSAIMAGWGGNEVTREWQILTGDNTTIELKVRVCPIIIESELCVIVCAREQSDKKGRNAMERICYHEMMKHAGAIQGSLDFFEEVINDPKASVECLEWAKISLANLIETINSQKDLIAAENNTLSVQRGLINSKELITKAVEIFRKHHCADGRTLQIDASSKSIQFITDGCLLQRVIINLIKNALEASGKGDTVTVGCRQNKDVICFWVHNEAVMSKLTQDSIFRRSYSTKGTGRGLGTYSVKLLTENYLAGKVSFVSEEGQGTTFVVELPDTL